MASGDGSSSGEDGVPPEAGERLQKVLARQGVASRRKAEELIQSGRVIVNGVRAQLGMRVNSADEIVVDGSPLSRRSQQVTLMFNKPPGFLTTVHDDRGRKTVMEMLPRVNGLHPVGRLDLDSEGLLLFTTDGDLTLRLTHPRYGHTKTYRVWCMPGDLTDEALDRLRDGVELKDGVARALHAERRSGGCRLVLAEGRKRQVRRMLAAVGYQVTRLQRIAVGRLELGDLPLGKWRQLSEAEIELALKTN